MEASGPHGAQAVHVDDGRLSGPVVDSPRQLWSVAGYFALPDFVFGKSGSDFGFLIWPLGIWIAALGVLEAVGVPVFRFGSAGPLWRRALFVVLWLGPYFAICYRPL